jgi:hypothetical protein
VRHAGDQSKKIHDTVGQDIMTSKHLETITNHLATLHGHTYFRPQNGPLKERLMQQVLDDAAGELAEESGEGSFDIEVSIGNQEGDGQPSVSFKVDRLGAVHTSQLALSLLGDEALEDLAGYLLRLGKEAIPAVAAASGKTPLGMQPDADHLEKGAASARLKVSPEWLKRVIPCTDYSYEEIDGKKYIREYYWSKELIEKLFKIKSTKTTPEDLQYVAQECCEGDVDWARDLIARLKSPNRPEPAAKDQTQKSQGRPAQAQPKAVPNERVRSRSRHKKPFREPGKDPNRKPEAAAAQKEPQK